jgi:DNA-binding MarR family transcriptional regulator
MTTKQAGWRNRKTAAPETVSKVKSSGGWTFLTNHAHVLAVLHRDPETVLREVASEVGITERAVQRIIQDLEEGGFIQRQRVGRQNRYHIIQELPLRHPIESHRKIGDLLSLVAGQPNRARRHDT